MFFARKTQQIDAKKNQLFFKTNRVVIRKVLHDCTEQQFESQQTAGLCSHAALS